MAMTPPEQERDERRNRIVIAGSSVVMTVAAVVVAVRVSPRVLVVIAGSSQVGKALRSMRG